ncbi:Alpha/Beta hydrolase protein [Gamsiella multidivaricata]|uniref:Alpha/Beta hydrolase protein n=1 Tax=Gamsiella multidivaricata TaxID=101098 RepID=UPI00221FC272|nr:Alpha/Beta hydrolase protein [Gamsiella multidivaricata]KAI7821677.1 Alpha/Beta hydrolase protein [Gamsiella multidivaricata]
MGIVSLVRSTWAIAYAASTVSVLILTGVAITGLPTKNRTANVVLSLLNNHMSELPLTVVLMDAFFYFWLGITGQSAMVRFFNYVNLISAVGLLYLFKRSFDAKGAVEKFLDQHSKESKSRIDLPGPSSPRFWKQLLNPLHSPQNCTVYENIPYWVPNEQVAILRSDGWKAVLEMALDVYKPNKIYIHGGGWTSGSKSLTGPLLTELIAREWIVVAIDYRLTAKAGYPTQLIDCKRALRWVKDEIRIFGGDPKNIILGGDSSGGHLAALMALTPNLPEFQPGFENVDTTVQGCVPQSAALDLTDLKNQNYSGSRGRFIKQVAHREGSAESPENMKFLTEHSPIFRVQDSKVPFLVVQ